MAVSHGRPQDTELTQRILEETLRRLQERGYAALRIEQVAAAVGCGKAAIYRRWPDRGVLAAAALTRHSRLGTIPDTGTVTDDLLAHAWQNVRNQQDPGPDASAPLWAIVVEPDVRQHFWDGFLAHRREMGRVVVRRGMDRGELPAQTDVDAVLDLLAGFTLYRTAVRSAPLQQDDIRRVVAALVTAPPLLSVSHQTDD